MAKKGISIVLLIVCIGLILSSCVTQPRFSDYIGSDKSDALSDLRKQKTSNTIKLVLNWLLWGWVGLWIPSIVDTVNYFSYLDDFNTVGRKIENTPIGSKVGQ